MAKITDIRWIKMSTTALEVYSRPAHHRLQIIAALQISKYSRYQHHVPVRVPGNQIKTIVRTGTGTGTGQPVPVPVLVIYRVPVRVPDTVLLVLSAKLFSFKVRVPGYPYPVLVPVKNR